MKRLYFLLIALVGMGQLALAQPYSIDWSTIDGGGGTSTGGVFAISGTIGQPDAGAALTGGDYSLVSGFWSLQAIQTAGAPLLSIEPAGAGMATISWSPDTPGWILQETPSFTPTNWMNSASVSTNPVTVPAAGESKFYRLHKP